MIDERKMGNYSGMSDIPKQGKTLYWISPKNRLSERLRGYKRRDVPSVTS